jgi:hypothetical protein
MRGLQCGKVASRVESREHVGAPTGDRSLLGEPLAPRGGGREVAQSEWAPTDSTRGGGMSWQAQSVM